MFLQIIIIILIILFIYILYLHKKMHYHFDKNGIKYIPGIPVFGNIFKSTFVLRHTVEDMDAVYKAFPEERYVGFMEGNKRSLIIRDPELIKLISVKDFDCFASKPISFPIEVFPLLGRGLISMEGGDKWRQMRNYLSPAFTGTKLRFVMLSITDICSNYMEYLKGKQDKDIDVGDLIYRYCNDVFASAAFGVQINSVKDLDNKFYMAGQDSVTFTFWKRICFYLATQSFVLLKVFQVFGVHIISMETEQFFKNTIADSIQYRKRNNINRPDLLHRLAEASEEWSADDITAQALSFYLAGFESASSSITMCIHELAVNPVCQEKLYQEIREEADSNEKLSYESLNALKYLNCVVNESLRKWSPALVTDRVCTKAYDLPPPRQDGKPYRVKPGDIIYNAINSTHLNPIYHPDPEVYRPERFSDENKQNIKPFTFMPFGMGPRNCLGNRFSILETKLFIYYLILNFNILKCEKTSDPIRLMAHEISIKAFGGTWIRVQSRLN